MQNTQELYFLTVEQAEAIAAHHENDENWDFWEALKNESIHQNYYLETVS